MKKKTDKKKKLQIKKEYKKESESIRLRLISNYQSDPNKIL